MVRESTLDVLRPLLTYKTDKLTHHSYGSVYADILTPAFTHKALSVLEIGVLQGESLKAWADIFPHATILGVDIEPVEIIPSNPRIRTYQTDAGDYKLMSEFRNQFVFDLVIDDGSHDINDQLAALFALWPGVKSGGYYVIEDIFSKYLPVFENMPCDLHEGSQFIIADNIAVFRKP